MASEYLTVVIRLPEDRQQRETIAQTLRVGESFHGGRITAMSLEDEITVIELLEAKLPASEVDEARAQAKRLHARAEAAG
jgi:hypothetical protein